MALQKQQEKLSTLEFGLKDFRTYKSVHDVDTLFSPLGRRHGNLLLPLPLGILDFYVFLTMLVSAKSMPMGSLGSLLNVTPTQVSISKVH